MLKRSVSFDKRTYEQFESQSSQFVTEVGPEFSHFMLGFDIRRTSFVTIYNDNKLFFYRFDKIRELKIISVHRPDVTLYSLRRLLSVPFGISVSGKHCCCFFS